MFVKYCILQKIMYYIFISLLYSILLESHMGILFIILVILLIILLIIIIVLALNINDDNVSNFDKGLEAEKYLMAKLIRAGVSEEDIFHDLYVEKYDGNFSQIDIVVLTKVGIIVIEVKNFSGWIFGNESQNQWTQLLAYGKRKYRFYNPIMQNSYHILELRKSLKQFQTIPFYSVIIFYGDCELKNISFTSKNTFVSKQSMTINIMNTILNNNETIDYSNKNEIIELLKKYTLNGENEDIRNHHSNNVKEYITHL